MNKKSEEWREKLYIEKPWLDLDNHTIFDVEKWKEWMGGNLYISHEKIRELEQTTPQVRKTVFHFLKKQIDSLVLRE